MKSALNPLAQLVRDLDSAGLRLALRGDRIAVSPAGNLTPDLRSRIAPLRAELVELLAIHGEALMPLFRAPGVPLSEADRKAIQVNAAALSRKAEVAA